MYKIQYKRESPPIPENWTTLGPFTEPDDGWSNARVEYTLNDLPYANEDYTFRFLLKFKDAADIDKMWSTSIGSFRTRSREPDGPPRTDIGSFRIDKGQAFIYWEELLETKRNGGNFHYTFTVDEKNYNDLGDTETKIELIDPNKTLDVHIYSKNEDGRSVNSSVVHIPAVQDRFDPPTKIKVFKESSMYNISWKAPEHAPKITSYTVFWCKTNSDFSESSDKCGGSIHFERLSGDVLNYTLNTTESMNVAVSANSDTSSSGMVWAMCTVSPEDEIGKLEENEIGRYELEARIIKLGWSLKCKDASLIAGYNLEYCPIDPKIKHCKEPIIMRNITGDALEYQLENLQPETTYMVRIRLKDLRSAEKFGNWSEYVLVKTKSEPTIPLSSILYIIIVVVALIVMTYFGDYCYKWYNGCRGIGIDLPEGLRDLKVEGNHDEKTRTAIMKNNLSSAGISDDEGMGTSIDNEQDTPEESDSSELQIEIIPQRTVSARKGHHPLKPSNCSR